jgi:glycosyltransferase involved in cell wall biosynthesis
VLTATALHALAADRGAFLSRSKLGALSMFVHWPLAKPRDRFSLTLAARVRAESLFLVPTCGVRASLLEADCDHVAQIAYPATRADNVRLQAPFKHLLMAGAARINKGLDVIAGLAELLARDARLAAAEGVSSTNELLAEPPLLVQVSPKHVGKTGRDRHGAREDAVVARLLAANYRGLVADPKAPDRDEYAKRFEGALVLAPYERAKFADGVSGVVLDALLHGAPVVATSGTWAGDVVERFDAGVAIRERTPEALRAAVARVLGRWDLYVANAAKASEVLAAEHDPRALALAIASHG